MRTFLFPTGAVLLLLFSLSACFVKPVEPDPALLPVEPDTADSYVSATVQINNTPPKSWNVRNKDTLSKGIFGFNRDGVKVWRNDIIRSSIIASHNTHPRNRTFSINIYHNFDISASTKYNPNNGIDSLRVWTRENLAFFFIVPEKIAAPFSPDTLRAFDWFTSRAEERIEYNSQGMSWSIYSFFNNRLIDIRYDLLTIKYNPNPFPDDSRIEEAKLIIDRYDTVKKRVSGRFQFKIFGSGYYKDTITIRDGVFENVQVLTLSDS